MTDDTLGFDARCWYGPDQDGRMVPIASPSVRDEEAIAEREARAAGMGPARIDRRRERRLWVVPTTRKVQING